MNKARLYSPTRMDFASRWLNLAYRHLEGFLSQAVVHYALDTVQEMFRIAEVSFGVFGLDLLLPSLQIQVDKNVAP